MPCVRRPKRPVRGPWLCPCGEPATSRPMWVDQTNATVLTPSTRPTHCAPCADATARAWEQDRRAEADETTGRWRAWVTEARVPSQRVGQWHRKAAFFRQSLNAGGPIRCGHRDGRLLIEVWEPSWLREDQTWEPEQAVAMLRQLMRDPQPLREWTEADEDDWSQRRHTAPGWGRRSRGTQGRLRVGWTPTATSDE